MPGRSSNVQYSGMMDCLKKIVHHEGYFGLFRGMQANFYKSLPATAISYAAFEQTKKFLS
jgi:hypothetical protein